MKIVLVNTDPMVAKLIEATAKKTGIALESYAGLSKLDVSILAKDSFVFLDEGAIDDHKDIAKKIGEDFLSCFLYAKTKAISEFAYSVKKPFLPTQILDILQEELLKRGQDLSNASDIGRDEIAEDTLHIDSIDSQLRDFSVSQDFDESLPLPPLTDQSQDTAPTTPDSPLDFEDSLTDENPDEIESNITAESSNTESNLESLESIIEPSNSIDSSNADDNTDIAISDDVMQNTLDSIESDSTQDDTNHIENIESSISDTDNSTTDIGLESLSLESDPLDSLAALDSDTDTQDTLDELNFDIEAEEEPLPSPTEESLETTQSTDTESSAPDTFDELVASTTADENIDTVLDTKDQSAPTTPDSPLDFEDSLTDENPDEIESNITAESDVQNSESKVDDEGFSDISLDDLATDEIEDAIDLELDTLAHSAPKSNQAEPSIASTKQGADVDVADVDMQDSIGQEEDFLQLSESEICEALGETPPQEISAKQSPGEVSESDLPDDLGHFGNELGAIEDLGDEVELLNESTKQTQSDHITQANQAQERLISELLANKSADEIRALLNGAQISIKISFSDKQ